MDDTTTMASLAEHDIYPNDLGDDWHMPYRVSVTDDGHADITWREELRFHRELADRDAENYGDRNPAYKPWSHYTRDGWLAAENEAVLVAELQRLTGLQDIETVEDGDADGEDGYIAFSIRTDYETGETVEQWADRIGWRVIATLKNATDPGIFMYPYLFSAMLYRDAD